MAFLCPIRFGRSRSNKKERLESVATPMIGRITGSASIDTLVRVGLEKERVSASSKAVVVQDFVPQVDDELGVERGEIVYVLYKENDWVSQWRVMVFDNRVVSPLVYSLQIQDL